GRPAGSLGSTLRDRDPRAGARASLPGSRRARRGRGGAGAGHRPDPVAPPQEAGQTDAAARETPAVAEPEPVPHVAPRIVSRWPRRRDALRVTEGAALDFGVRAASEKRDARLAYAWFGDGRRVGRRERWRFLA